MNTLKRTTSFKRRLNTVAPLLVGLLLAGAATAFALSTAYVQDGYAQCKAKGNSTLWCASTIRLQAFRTYFNI